MNTANCLMASQDSSFLLFQPNLYRNTMAVFPKYYFGPATICSLFTGFQFLLVEMKCGQQQRQDRKQAGVHQVCCSCQKVRRNAVPSTCSTSVCRARQHSQLATITHAVPHSVWPLCSPALPNPTSHRPMPIANNPSVLFSPHLGSSETTNMLESDFQYIVTYFLT